MLKKFLTIFFLFSFCVFPQLSSLSNTIQRGKEEVTKIYDEKNIKIELDGILRNDALDGQSATELTHYAYKRLTIQNSSDKEIKLQGNIFNRVSRIALVSMLQRSLREASKSGGYVTGGQQALNYVSKSVIPDGVFDYTLKPAEKKELVFVMPISVQLKGQTFWKGKIYDAQGSNPYIAINLSSQESKPVLLSYNIEESSARELLEADLKRELAFENIQNELKKAKTNKKENEKSINVSTKQKVKVKPNIQSNSQANSAPEEGKPAEQKVDEKVDKEQILESINTLKDLNEAIYKYALIDGKLDKNKLSGIYIYNGSNFDAVVEKAQILEKQVKLDDLSSKATFTKSSSGYLQAEGSAAQDSFKQEDLHILLFQNAKGLPMLRSLELYKFSLNKDKKIRTAYKPPFSELFNKGANQIQFTGRFIRPGVYALNFKDHPFNKFEKLSAGEYVIKPVGASKGYDFRIEAGEKN